MMAFHLLKKHRARRTLDDLTLEAKKADMTLSLADQMAILRG